MYRPNWFTALFAGVALVFQMTLADVDGWAYFPLAALCDFTVAAIAYRFGMSRKATDVMLVSLVSLALNLFGWVMWYLYLPSTAYEVAFQIFYPVVAMLFARKGGGGDGAGCFKICILDVNYNPNVNSGGGMVHKGETAL